MKASVAEDEARSRAIIADLNAFVQTHVTDQLQRFRHAVQEAVRAPFARIALNALRPNVPAEAFRPLEDGDVGIDATFLQGMSQGEARDAASDDDDAPQSCSSRRASTCVSTSRARASMNRGRTFNAGLRR